MMRTDALVDRLVSQLKPVRRRSVLRQGAILLALGAAELGGFLAIGFMRPDMPDAMDRMSFWWKLASMGLIAVLGAVVAILSGDPARSPRRGLRWLLTSIVLIVASGWAIDALHDGWAHVLDRLDWTSGLQCVWKMVVLSLPAVAALSLLIRRGAPTDRSGTALAAALSAAAWGAFVFVFACPSDDPLYLAVWYTVGCGIVTLFGRLIVLRSARW
jgi:hypothetical protein